MFVTKILQVLLLAVLNDWCSGADIDSIFSDFFTKNKDPKSILEKESIFSDLRSDTDQPSSVKELLDSVPKRGNRVTRTNPVEDDRPVWGTPGPTKAELPNFHSTNPTGGQNGRATSSGTTFQPQQAQTTPQSQSNSDKNILPTYRTIVKVDKEVADPLYVPNHMKDFVTSPSMIYCLNYCTFPVNYPLAQGGTDAIPHEFPHMVALGFGSGTFQGKSLVSWNSCGGSLISKNFVLTAAHCLDSVRGPPTQVRVGEHDLSKVDAVVPAQDFPILRIIIHPSYNSSTIYHDIALLQLARDVPFTRAWNLGGEINLFKVIWPACLHQGLNVKRYENEREYQNQEVVELPHRAVATGWGNTGFVDAPSDILQKVDLDIIDYQSCKRLLGRDALIPNGVDEKTQVCAGVLAGGRDTCNGDSGGPLQMNNTMFYWRRYCPMEIVGITSFGRFCGNADSPSVYTRVSHYVPWIESIVWPTVPKTFASNG